MREDGDELRVLCEPADLSAVREALEAAGVEIGSAEVTMEPKSTVEVGKGDARALLGLLDALEDHDDVSEVHANFDIPEEVMAEDRRLGPGRHPRLAQNPSPCKS